ncbi:MAG TPA: thiosulfate oxidation carrier complex protein SoxZ [Gemmatimonadaceae bacterium]|nr:thiosulfate oxidation carrier complex protein SoxZ [Gemmatimonadaceae bacterium]
MTPAIGDPRILLPGTITRGAVIHVRALISHPMLTGLSRDAQGRAIPAHFIDSVTVEYGGEQVARFEWTSGISRDPYVAFPLRATREAPLSITWKDNTGSTFRQTVDVRFTA